MLFNHLNEAFEKSLVKERKINYHKSHVAHYKHINNYCYLGKLLFFIMINFSNADGGSTYTVP
jgi:hypothetical protein